MAADRLVEIQKIAATTADKYATFDGGIQSLVVTADADIYIQFDEPAAATTGFLVKGGVTNNPWEFPGGNVKQVHVVAVSTANVYLMGIRN